MNNPQDEDIERVQRLVDLAGAEKAGRWKAEKERDELRGIASDLITLTPGGEAWNRVVDRLHELDSPAPSSGDTEDACYACGLKGDDRTGCRANPCYGWAIHRWGGDAEDSTKQENTE